MDGEMDYYEESWRGGEFGLKFIIQLSCGLV
jgi:hypothetical protein